MTSREDGESAFLNEPDRPRSRTERFDCVAADGRFDVIVVGGGINGIGVYRDLALQGLRVLLVERSDFCSGCSCAPSRMIHGGLRYLENGELSLVRDSLRERDMLLANAPHMVRALPVTVPIVSITSGLLNAVPGVLGRGGRPAARGAIAVKLGLTFYDWLTKGRRILPGHRFRGRAATLERWPALGPKVRCSATYFDAWISFPERLCVELIRDTERAARLSPALNYVHLSSVPGGGFHVRDQTDGRTVPVTARALVNATGAWADETVRELAVSGKRAPRLVSGTKGSHLVLNNPRLHSALDGHMLYFENSDRRICIALPYLDRVLVGSTDIRVETPGRVRCEEDETAYLLASLRALLPGLRISRSDIVFSYSGVRPLPRSDAEFTGRISRGYSVCRLDGEPPLYCMVGGKCTTFRAFAECTADMVLRDLGTDRRCSTRSLAIGGGRDFPDDPEILIDQLCSGFRVSPGRARHLLDHYGTLAPRVQAHCAGLAGGDAGLGRGCHYTRGEIDYLVRTEFAVNLSDMVLRRTSLAITGSIDAGMLREIAENMANVLGWSAHEMSRQMQSLLDELKTYHNAADVRIPCPKPEERTQECE